MFLSDVIATLYAAGFSTEVVEEAQRTIFAKYPSVEAEIFERPMNTAIADPEVPDAYVDKLFRELNVPEGIEL